MNYDARIDGATEADVVAYDPLAEPAEEARRSRRQTIIIAVVVAVVLILLWFMMHRSSQPALGASAASQAPTVSVIAPGRTTVGMKITATGTLAARRELPVGVAGEGGQVIAVTVDAGQWVKQGQVLAVVDRAVQVQQAAGQAAQIEVAQADARIAQDNLDRALKLVDRGFISKADVDRLRATRDSANAKVGVARASLGEIKARNQRLNVVAPAAGLLLERKVDPGQVIGSGSGVLFRIAKGGEMELLAKLSESDLARLSPGVPAQVTPVGSSRSYTGQIWQVSPVIDPQTRQGTARIALPYAPDLRPGGFATATIAGGTVVAPILPESAILSDANGSYVYVVGANNKIVRRPVKTGDVSEAGIAVVQGLNGTERVVLRAGGFLNPGDLVDPVLVKR